MDKTTVLDHKKSQKGLKLLTTRTLTEHKCCDTGYVYMAADEFLTGWKFCSHRFTLTVRKLRRLVVQSSLTTERKY